MSRCTPYISIAIVTNSEENKPNNINIDLIYDIPKQKITRTKENSQISVSQTPSQNCTGNACSPGARYTGPMQTGSSTIIEDLPPEKIEIPVRLLEKHFHQASLRLWTGIRINLY